MVLASLALGPQEGLSAAAILTPAHPAAVSGPMSTLRSSRGSATRPHTSATYHFRVCRV